MYKAVQNANTNVVTWEEIGTGYKDCAVGPNNRIWGIKKDDNTIIFDVGGPDEQQVEGEATKIAVDHYNVAWVIGGDDDVNGGQVYKYIGRLSIWDAPPAKFQTRRYRFQKKNGSNNWRNTDYLWCVQEPFFPSIGDLEVYVPKMGLVQDNGQKSLKDYHLGLDFELSSKKKKRGERKGKVEKLRGRRNRRRRGRSRMHGQLR